MEEEMRSTISNGLGIIDVGNVAERSDSNSSSTTPPCLTQIKDKKNKNSSTYPRFKGVVKQQNGNWGAQIYANHQRIWLGTFKTESEAAMAYDSAAIKLRKGDSHRNFPWSAITIHEPQFQDLFSTEAILGLIKDGSYHSKFVDFIMTQCLNIGNNYHISGTNQNPQRKEQGILYHELFQKELTPSDVGKLNRLVIPKKQAMAYFPKIHDEAGTEEESPDNHLYVTFFDTQNKPWSFRYCYWKSSQSFVFTKGWNRFVKKKNLKANDIVTFYSCDYRNIHPGKLQAYYMIETKSKNGEETGDDGCGEGRRNHLELQQQGLEGINPQGLMEQEQSMIRGEQIINKGIRLFGVNIFV